MRRSATADWCAGALAILVFALGGLVVVKPAVDHWNDIYRGDPYHAETKTETIRTKAAGQAAVRTTITRNESAWFGERALGKGGLLILRLALVALTAFLAGAVLQRIILGNYGLRARPFSGEVAGMAPPRRLVKGQEPQAEQAAVAQNGSSENGSNGEGRTAAAEGNGAELASSIGKFVSWRREELGLSQRELAKRAGISHTVVSRLESGQQVPSAKTLERLAEAFRN
jgi:DNA-binding XRE family transcriptional regulator